MAIAVKNSDNGVESGYCAQSRAELSRAEQRLS